MSEILGTAGNDELFGGQGIDSLFGLEGDDTILGLEGDDLIFGNQGLDFLGGGEGNDTIFGGKGDDFLGDIGGGDDQFFGNLDNDLLNGGEGNDQLFGGQGDDGVFGSGGNDLVSGDKGDDILFGIDTENITNPGLGEIDTLVGGEGSDLFALGFESPSYYVGSGNSDFGLITDFNVAEDTIFVSATDNVTISDLDLGEFGSGAGIFSQNGDLIGLVQGVAASQLSFDINIIRA
ncbi:calcium-binding protein [Capilliphycus salinus ALCB114379]|uniref:calcium-binding protein n=1 Tax=Capilliphycus salinus TaxID=2768948 RepID=UPI0039A56D70